MLCTITDIKTRLGLSAEYDAILTEIVAGVTGLFEAYCNRKFIVPAAAITETYTGDSEYLQLLQYPVVSITSIKEAWDYDFAAATALVANTDYRLMNGGLKGILLRLYGNWCSQPDGIQVVYRGGYTAAGSTPGTGETAVPADLKESAIQAGCILFKRRDDIGLSSISALGGSVSVFSELNFPPLVKMTLDANYRRLS